MSIVGTLLPEQVRFFAEHQNLERTIDWFNDYVQPYHLFVDGKYIKGFYPERSVDYLKEYQSTPHRIVVLDALGQIVLSEEKPLTPGHFHLVYTVEAKDCEGLWEFFEWGFNHLVNEDDSGASVWTISVGELANEPFTDAVDYDLYPQELREYVFNLQQIARLYPLLEIKIYR